MFSESAQLIVWGEKNKKKKLFHTLSSLCWCVFPSLCLMCTVSWGKKFHHCGIAGSQSSFFCCRSADLSFCLFHTGVGRTTALQTGSSSPGCHGSWKLLRGVCRNPTGRSCALVYLCIGDGLGEMKAAKVGKSHPPLWLENIWCVLTHKHSASVQAGFTARLTHTSKGFFPPVQQIKTNKGLEVWRGSYYHSMCLLFFDLCMETSVRAGSGVILISKQSTLNRSSFFWFLCSVSGCNVRKHHSGFDSHGSCFSSSCLFCDYLLAVEGDIFPGGCHWQRASLKWDLWRAVTFKDLLSDSGSSRKDW